MKRPIIVIVAALSQNGIIGQAGDLPWKMPADLKHFRQLSLGKIVIMGRKTFDSLKKTLSGRKHVVLSRDKNYHPSGVRVARSLSQVLTMIEKEKEVVIAGGASVYQQFLPLADKMYLTMIQTKLKGDTSFPDYASEKWEEKGRKDYPADRKNPFPYSFITLVRRKIEK